MRLLLAEDDTMLGDALSEALSQAGYKVSWFKDGESSELAAIYQPFDVAVLDINLPKRSGLDILKSLRTHKRMLPVLILTARDTPPYRVEGLDLGADDYMVKPFDLEELLARLRSVIRRSQGRTENVIVVREVTYNPQTMQVTKEGVLLSLQPKEISLIALLMRSAGSPVSKSRIEEVLYDTEEVYESNTVEVLIYGLRKKLGYDFIKTQRGIGYMIPL